MTLLDANLLLYATDSTSGFHDKARHWLETLFSRPEPVRLAWTSILAFLRISTHPRLRGQPFLMKEAVAIVEEWLVLPNVAILAPGERHWAILRDLLAAAQARGPLITDVHLAALAIEHGATLCTNDRDFARIPGVRVIYPLGGDAH